MDPGFFALLRCPACNTEGMDARGTSAQCTACGRRYVHNGDFLELLSIEPTAPTAEQRFMESELVARLYERFWRPTFVRVMAGSGARASTGGFPGEFFIHKHALAMEDRDGPWLDLSCGSGLFTRAMAASDPGGLVVGLDISRAMLEAAAGRSKGYSNVMLVRADAHSLPFADASFGGVNNSGALHAYDDPEQVFVEIARVLRPGGIYVGSTFSHYANMMSRMTARMAGIRRYEPVELRAWLSRLGFADYDEIQFGGAFIFRVRKP